MTARAASTSRPRTCMGFAVWIASFIAGVFLCLTAPLRAEQPGHQVRVWESGDGLPGNVVRSLAQASDGFLWVATAEGVARFDGLAFELIEPEARLPRPRAAFWRLFAMPSGAVWATTTQGGLYRVSGGTLQRALEESAGPRAPRVTQLIEENGETFFRRGGEVWEVAAEGPRVMAEPDAGILRKFQQDLALSTDAGRRGGNDAPPVLKSRSGALWEAGPGTGLRLAGGGGLEETVLLPEVGTGFLVNELLEDREGNVWLATAVHGLVRLRRAQVRVLDDTDGLHERAVSAVMQDRSGAWWFANRGGGLDRVDADGTTHFELDGPGYRPATAIFEDRDRRLWVAARDGSVFLKEGGRFVPRFSKTQTPSKVRAIAQDADGFMWFGGSQGLAVVDGESVRTLQPAEGLETMDVSVIETFAGGRLIIGTTTGRVLVGDAAGFSRLGGGDELGARWVSGILARSPTEVWATTLGGGLFLWNGSRWIGIGRESGLPDSRLTCVLDDGLGHLWFGSLGGILRAERQELLAHARAPERSVSWLRLDRSDGMPSRECIGGSQPAGWLGNEGGLWFPTGGGVVRVRPGELAVNEVPPPVFLESVRANGVTSSGRERMVSAGPGRSRLEFGFVGLSYAAPEKVTYRARLAGLDDAWRELGHQRTASFEAVPPGRYSFEVVAINGDGMASAAAAAIPVRIAPHVWETKWFLGMGGAAVLLTAAGGGWAVARSRMKRRIQNLKVRHAREGERARIARDLHDDLGASLTEISILAALAAEDAGESALHPALDQLSAKAKTVVGTLDEIVWAVNPREDTLRSLVDYFAAFSREFLDLAGLSLRLELPRGIPDLPLAAGQRHGVFLAAREALNNIVKHAKASEVRIVVSLDGRRLGLRITDDGRGFNPEHFPAGDGLDNLRQRMRELGGECRIASNPAGGTTVILLLPLPH